MLTQRVDAAVAPDTGEGAATVWAQASGLMDMPGVAYLEKRRIPLEIATAAELRYCASFNGRPAILSAMRNLAGELLAVHGRYLSLDIRGTKMLTVGRGGGTVSILNGLDRNPLILVEGLFDALSMATCGLSNVATIGRWSSELPAWAADRTVILAFDGNKVGDEAADQFSRALPASRCLRLKPPDRSKDWNTALCKMGQRPLSAWLSKQSLLHVLNSDRSR